MEPNSITGTFFDDTLTGTNLNDVIIGFGGDDLLIGRAGNDLIEAGEGADTLSGGTGNNLLNGGSGFDTADFADLAGAITLEAAGAINKGIAGTDLILEIEKIIGAVGQPNTINGNGTLPGSVSGSPVSFDIDLARERLTVIGIPGAGPQEFQVVNFVNAIGTTNADTIKGNSQDNIIRGGAGNDTIIASGGNDLVDGGEGADLLDYSQLGRAVTIKPEGTDKGNGELDSPPIGFETVRGAIGLDNAIDARSSNSSTVFIDVDLAVDRLTLGGLSTGGTASINVENFVDVAGTNNSDIIAGNSLDNLLQGAAGADTLKGNAGADLIEGNSGTDSLLGSSGADTLNGGIGNDTLSGGQGTDTLTGGSGADTFVIRPNSGKDVITDFEVGIDRIDLRAFNFSDVLNTGVTFSGVNDSIPGFTFSFAAFPSVEITIANRDLPLPSSDVIV